MTEKVLTYLNTLGVVVLIVLSFWHPGPGVKLGVAAPSTATTFSDLNVDNSNGIGNASYYVNGTAVLTSGGLNVTLATATTLNATTINGTTVNATNLVIGSGTAIAKYSCATATVAFATVGASTSTSAFNSTTTNIALAGAAVGDVCLGSLTSATTSNALITCNITGAGTSTLTLTNVANGASLSLASGTGKVCYAH